LGTQGAQAGHAVGDGWIIFRAKTMGYFLFDKSCRRLRSFDLVFKNQKIAAFGSSYRGVV
ncbi:hypothetical protein, partial [Pseudomonas sp. GV085]|uniref:hypothetical protein n=1 Tax=Pseudomonas sp. GV085 TaxID=2135756 RepID=UPI0035327826